LCGIFGFALTKPLPLENVFKLLEKLEIHQYPQEPKPVGGYGAGVAILRDDGSVILEKVGWVDGSPAKRLSENVKISEASILVGHVRMPSPEFMETARFEETAQPYVSRCYEGLIVVSAHNGNVINYKEIRKKLGKTHTFESERVELIDSELIPHYFEELLKEKSEVSKALDALSLALKGSNAISLLQIEKESSHLHFIHMGKTRGLTIWTNDHGEIVFCSRKEPLMEEFGGTLVEGKFKEEISIRHHERKSLKASFALRQLQDNVNFYEIEL